MTRQEITGTRDLRFSRWMRINLPKSNTGWVSSDIDFYIYSYHDLFFKSDMILINVAVGNILTHLNARKE